MKPWSLAGGQALADFRLRALLESLNADAPGIDAARIDATFVFFIECDAVPDADIQAKVHALLGAREDFPSGGPGFFVTPRKGTISPWSSKATDIFHNCGLSAIRRVERGIHYLVRDARGRTLDPAALRPALNRLHDRMTEGVYEDLSDMFQHRAPAPFVTVDALGGGLEALREANRAMGLALSDAEMTYLLDAYLAAGRNPTDVELVMFGQVNSEHCRHKIFNAQWRIDGVPMADTLFGMIRNTHAKHPQGTLVAYKDNSGVLEGFEDAWFEVRRDGSNRYDFTPARIDMLLKVETHNHPTAISPYPGAATGVGGEIRDETATGVGGRSKAGLSGYMVSNLRVPGWPMPWERSFAEFPGRLATPLRIMLEGPIGGAGFGNEFGRPQLCGLFKTYEDRVMGRYHGYHKPIMLAGGMGNIKRIHTAKKDIPTEAAIVQLGGPAMRIGLGGGAASSMATGSNAEDLDFDSVQRGNAEMERRCQEVVDACIAMGKDNPILSIHDIGAGGLSNGCPELIAETGGRFHLREIPNEDQSMSPMEIWCCEAQERYVLAVGPAELETFLSLCKRERCPAAVIGHATGDGRLTLADSHFGNNPIDVALDTILGRPPRMLRDVSTERRTPPPLDLSGIALDEAVSRVLRLPAVANKTFLIAIADRSVTGLVARDQMVGPYQTPIADVAVTTTGFRSYTGEAMAMGERTNTALVSAPASGRMAVGEALTNIAAADIGALGNVKLSANWMCACGEPGEDAALFETVRAVGMELCPKLGVSIPVGKDSLSMRTLWTAADGTDEKMTAPLSLVVSAFAPVRDVRRTLTPELKRAGSALLLIDLARGRCRLGGSALAQVTNQAGDACPDLDDPADMVAFFGAIQVLIANGELLSYHDRSDGGLLATVAEMAIGGRRGCRIDVPAAEDPMAFLFAEELGAVVEVAETDGARVAAVFEAAGLRDCVLRLGATTPAPVFTVRHAGKTLYERRVAEINGLWSELTFRMQALRDNPDCAREEYEAATDEADPGIAPHVPFDPARPLWLTSDATPTTLPRPRMAVLREQGINGHVEMAAAFHLAGFECVDVHMTDLLAEQTSLDEFAGLVACGGFSYGDVLGAGAGWAKSILFNDRLKEMFRRFFERPDTFSLGVCNGCQMMSQLKSIIPGADLWPTFTRNRSEQFEARTITVEILPSPSVLLRGMEGARLPIAVAHGEGRAEDARGAAELAVLRYVDNRGAATERYPFNPNGTAGGLTGFTSRDGRATIMMPHPERGFRAVQMSYRPAGLFEGEEGPWAQMFRNARRFVARM